jgi:hypothetical protein
VRREALDIVSHSPHTEHRYIHVFHMSSNQSKLEINLSIVIWLCVLKSSPRFFCRLTAFFSTCWSRGTSESSTYGKQRICRCNFASTHFHVRGYRILFAIRNPCINRFANHFSIHNKNHNLDRDNLNASKT